MIQSGNKQADTAFIIIILLAVAYLVYKVSQAIAAGAGVVETGFTKLNAWLEGDNWDPAGLAVDYTKTNYPEYQFKLWADVLEDAIWSYPSLDLDTEDEQPIKDVMFSINNDEDLKAIIKAYGIRTSWLGFTGGNLPSSLRQFTPELVEPFNSHYEGWGMIGRV
jgi:hypothetical protein